MGNQIAEHMDGTAEVNPDCLHFPVRYAGAITKLLQAFPRYVRLDDLGLEDGDITRLVEELLEEGIAEMQG